MGGEGGTVDTEICCFFELVFVGHLLCAVGQAGGRTHRRVGLFPSRKPKAETLSMSGKGDAAAGRVLWVEHLSIAGLAHLQGSGDLP